MDGLGNFGREKKIKGMLDAIVKDVIYVDLLERISDDLGST